MKKNLRGIANAKVDSNIKKDMDGKGTGRDCRLFLNPV